MSSDPAARPAFSSTLVLVFAGAVIVVATFAAVALSLRGNVRSPEGFIYTLAKRKAHTADAIDQPKLVVISGSGGLFGIRAGILGERLGMPAVNAGLHGALGAAYIAWFGASLAKPGDVALVAIEDPLYVSEEMVTSDAVQLSWSRGDDYWVSLPWPEKLHYFRAVSPKYIWQLIRVRDEPVPRKVGPWRLDMMNAIGDFDTGSPTEYARRELALNRDRDARKFAGDELPYRLDPDRPSTRQVTAAIKVMKGRGVRVLATWGALLDDPQYDHALSRLRGALPEFYRAAGAEFIETPERGLLSGEDLFDTPFHANSRGARERTARLAEAICVQTDLCDAKQ